MLIYWSLFLLPAAMAIGEHNRQSDETRFGLAWIVAAMGLFVVIGLRWETGGDWFNYQGLVEKELWAPTPLSLANEPAFFEILKIAAHSSYGMLVVTSIGAAIFSAALVAFCLRQPRPWLCLAVAIPYFVIVLGMGYIRQGLAISLILMGLDSLKRARIIRYELWVVAASMFHTSALVFIPLGLFVSTTNLFARLGFAVLAMAMLYFALSTARAEEYITNYVVAELSSSGATVRVLMTAVPSALFLLFRSRFGLNSLERSVWTLLSWAGLGLLVLLAVLPSSTVVDRLGLYLLPLHLFVYARLPAALAPSPQAERVIAIGTIVLYALALFVWLNYADNVESWLPYRSYLFDDNICTYC